MEINGIKIEVVQLPENVAPIEFSNGERGNLNLPDSGKDLWRLLKDYSKTYDVIIDNGKVILSEKS